MRPFNDRLSTVVRHRANSFAVFILFFGASLLEGIWVGNVGVSVLLLGVGLTWAMIQVGQIRKTTAHPPEGGTDRSRDTSGDLS